MTQPLTEASARNHFESVLTPSAFKAAFRNHPAGISIITADAGNGPAGLTASSVFSVSADPAILVFSLSAQSSAAVEIIRADTVVVHLLGARQLELAKRFAASGADRFADTSIWTRMATGEPVLIAANAWLRGRIINRMNVGDSTVVAVQVTQARVPTEKEREVEQSEPLVYHNRCWHSLSTASIVE